MGQRLTSDGERAPLVAAAAEEVGGGSPPHVALGAAQVGALGATDDALPTRLGGPKLPPDPSEDALGTTREAAARPPDSGVFTFEASLRPGEGGELGMTYAQEADLPAVVVVTGISGAGAARAWNSGQVLKKQPKGQTDLCLRRGDRILAVDGRPRARPREKTSRAAVLDDLVVITVQRWPSSYQVLIKRESATDKLGMKLELVERVSPGRGVERIVRMGEVRGGFLGAWNTQAAAAERPYEVVTPGSEIVRVGASTSSPEDMMTALQVLEGDIHITVQRPEVETIVSRAAERAAARSVAEAGD